MKKVKIFGRGIPILAIVAIVMTAGMASAALVGYLSNTVTTDITVVSPMAVGISLGRPSWATTLCWRPADEQYPEGAWVDSFPESNLSNIHYWNEGDWADSITIDDIHGGETITLYVRSVNLADAVIIGFEEAIVTNLAGVTCDDFESVKFRTDSIYGDLGYGTEHELISGGCHQINANQVRFGNGNSTWGAGETDVTKIVVTFKPAASGTYTFTYRVVPAT